MRVLSSLCRGGAALAIFTTTALSGKLPSVAPEAAGFSPARLARIDLFFEREMAADRVPGSVVGIMRDGKIVLLKAYGHRDKAKGLQMQTDGIFGLASMTKPQVAVGVLALTEQGRLPLWSTLQSYFPAFANMKVAA